ncbi:MAG: permease-like cell division protein FtsX [Tidjanibacter sp.]|nr:permease-like cell division protein FtsX [Tidjanibacter sp.]
MALQENKSLQRKVRKSYMISTVSIALVLFLLGSMGYFILNALRAADNMKESMTLHVMLNKDINDETKAQLVTKFDEQEEIKNFVFISKEQAAKDFKEYAGSDFEEFLDINPLPDSYDVHLKADFSTKEAIHALEKRIATWDGVNEVVYQKAIIDQITTNLNKFTMLLLLFGCTLLIISLILLNNTINISIFSKRYLINTMKLVGASKWFIMKPFLGSSILQGVYAALIAIAMFAAMLAGLHESVPDLLVMAGRNIVYLIIGSLLVGGVLISLVFTLLSLNKFINMNTGKIHLY